MNTRNCSVKAQTEYTCTDRPDKRALGSAQSCLLPVVFNVKVYRRIFRMNIALVLASLFSIGAAALTSSSALAANCQDFTVRLQNATPMIEIKVTKFEYKDGSNWKTENLLGVLGYQRLDMYNSETYKRNLQGIGDENTQFRVTYQKRDTPSTGGGFTWGDDIVETTLTFKCHDNGTRTVRLYSESVAWQ